jgi:hypothetical protein
MITQFITVFLATLSAIILFKVFELLFLKDNSNQSTRFTSITPIEALESDLGRVFDDINERLPLNRKSSAFPMVFDIGYHNTWCDHKLLVEIVSAQLENAGWIVSKTVGQDDRVILLDIPRKVFN